MLTLKCTAKVRKYLGVSDSELSNDIEAISEGVLGPWYVNEFVVDRRKCLIFMNEGTLLSFIFFGAKKSNSKKGIFHEMCLRGIIQLLEVENFPIQVITRVIEDSQVRCFAKTDSKKVLGNMNDLVDMYQHMIMYEGGLATCNVGEIILKINRTPQRNIDWRYSIDAAKELLGEK